jgi:Skp family chaperone for outer membrane proteins
MKLRHVSAALVAGLSLVAAPAAFAQTAGGMVVGGIGVANRDLIVGSSNAYKAAVQALQTTYRPQFDQYKARRLALRAQIKPLADKFIADRKAPNPVAATLQAEYGQIQQIQQSGQQELEQIIEPVNLAKQFIIEQILAKLDDATQAAMTRRKITLVLDAQSVPKHDAVYTIDQDIIDQLNLVLPAVSVTPPAGWLPAQQRQQQAQEQAAAQAEAAEDAAGAPAAAKKQPQGR